MWVEAQDGSLVNLGKACRVFVFPGSGEVRAEFNGAKVIPLFKFETEAEAIEALNEIGNEIPNGYYRKTGADNQCYGRVNCPACKGHKYVMDTTGTYPFPMLCTNCNGLGTVINCEKHVDAGAGADNQYFGMQFGPNANPSSSE